MDVEKAPTVINTIQESHFGAVPEVSSKTTGIGSVKNPISESRDNSAHNAGGLVYLTGLKLHLLTVAYVVLVPGFGDVIILINPVQNMPQRPPLFTRDNHHKHLPRHHRRRSEWL